MRHAAMRSMRSRPRMRTCCSRSARDVRQPLHSPGRRLLARERDAAQPAAVACRGRILPAALVVADPRRDASRDRHDGRAQGASGPCRPVRAGTPRDADCVRGCDGHRLCALSRARRRIARSRQRACGGSRAQDAGADDHHREFARLPQICSTRSGSRRAAQTTSLPIRSRSIRVARSLRSSECGCASGTPR